MQKNKDIVNNSAHILHYDAVIIGGGISGLCCAIAAARGGVKTALVHNRPVLGGNASSEIRMHICGADNHGHRANARETGILEELLLNNKKQNPQESYSVFDTVLWELAYLEPNLNLYLNTHMTQVFTHKSLNKKIDFVEAKQLTTEKTFHFYGKFFVDTTGDGSLSALAGANYMLGREGKDIFNEPHAPEQSDTICMGNTLLFKTKDMKKPTPFIKPVWANTYTEDDLQGRDHGASGHNYWWIELGGDSLSTISDAEILRDDLLKAVYGVWDHIKNGGEHQADNFALEWVGFLPGKRESRRIVGDYILTENDLSACKVFEDTVAYGGWPMDMHIPGGLKTRLEPTEFIHVPDVYGIPYRSLYASTVSNLLMGGRILSASHMAFGSTRVMGTCAVIGQAIGTSLRFLVHQNYQPKDWRLFIDDLQQLLLREDAYIPSVSNKDDLDLARQSIVTASSSKLGAEAYNVIDGISRNFHESIHCWESDTEDVSWIKLDLEKEAQLASLEIKFDSNLSKQIMLTMFDNGKADHENGLPTSLIQEYELELYHQGNLIHTQRVQDNYQRFKTHIFSTPILCDTILVRCHSTYGDTTFKIFEIRAYE
jgi:hypothetical protein